jgi:hypothetical protein
MVIGLLLLVASTAQGLEVYMRQELPVYSRYQCASCHDTDLPSSNDLNDFGRDFALYGEWNVELAGLDSDGDGCDNGAELGDIDGNGVADDGVTRESSNPGVAGDCSSAFNDVINWGELKAIFKGQR